MSILKSICNYNNKNQAEVACDRNRKKPYKLSFGTKLVSYKVSFTDNKKVHIDVQIAEIYKKITLVNDEAKKIFDFATSMGPSPRSPFFYSIDPAFKNNLEEYQKAKAIYEIEKCQYNEEKLKYKQKLSELTSMIKDMVKFKL